MEHIVHPELFQMIYLLIHLTSIMALWGRYYYYAHFISGENWDMKNLNARLVFYS